MANSMLQALNATNLGNATTNNTTTNSATPQINVGEIKNMMGMLGNTKDPTAIMNMLAQKNPIVSQALQMANGGNPMQIAQQMAQKMGIDFNSLMQQIKS